MVVLHYTGMADAASAMARLCDPAAKVSSHYLIAQAGEVDRGMDSHATHVTGYPLPRHLAQRPASVVAWDTMAGASAVRAHWAAGYVRRDGFVWEIIATGADPDALARLVIGLATTLADFTARPVTGPDPSEPRFTGGLWSLLPTEFDLPAPMRLDSVFTDDGVYDAQTVPRAA